MYVRVRVRLCVCVCASVCVCVCLALLLQVGDGDCGDTVAHGARAILTDLPTKYPRNDPAGTVACLAASVRQAVGGTSGALYDVALTAAARCLKVCACCVCVCVCLCACVCVCVCVCVTQPLCVAGVRPHAYAECLAANSRIHGLHLHGRMMRH